MLTAIARQGGPLLDDAVLALGRIGDPGALDALADVQRSAPPPVQPIVHAAACLLGADCAAHEKFLIDTLKATGEKNQGQEVVRAAATALGALVLAGRSSAAEALLAIALHAPDSVRAPIALAVATLALRHPPLTFTLFEKNPTKEGVALLAEGFDMLEEDFEKERFFALARKTYWSASADSPARALMQTLIVELEF